MAKILVADDDPGIRDVICFALEREGFSHDVATDGEEALRKALSGGFDLLVLDIGMPERDGLEVCREIRRGSGLPILFLSARDEEIDRILGLELGADDYVTKPFSPRELTARVKAILKRAAAAAAPRDGEERTHGRLRLMADARRVECAGEPVELTAREFDLLHALMRRPAMVFTRDQLMTAIYGGGIHVSGRTIDSHVRNLRAKLARAGCEKVIETVHGVGFRLHAAERT